MSTDLLAAARRYAAKGWPVFPCRPRGKEPLTPNGFANATTDEAQIIAWWTQWPDANIGFVPGRAGLICFDLDGPEGETAAQRFGLCAEPTLSITTGRGRHLYFQRPAFHVGNRPLAPHLDVRCDEGYTLLPPSVHGTGAVYTRAGTVQDLKQLPPTLDVLGQGNGRPRAAPLPERIPEGERNVTLASIAGSMRRRGASEQGILAALREENTTRCEPPLDEDELTMIARSVGRYAPEVRPLVPVTATPAPSAPLTPWGHAQPAPDFLRALEEEHDFLEPKLLAPGAVTLLFSPRGLGKTHIAHALAVRLARAGRRVLLIDRDNSPREIRRRLKGWDAGSAPNLEVLTRDKAPPLTDTVAWTNFPVDRYDVLIIDSVDATTEGVGEQDSSKPSRAWATLLNIARRPHGPAVLALGNTIKSAAHSRGSGVVEDRADVVFEVRDCTDVRPTGSKPWWEELPPAGAEAWAQRATRRKKRDKYRLAMVPSKFRLGEEPEPFVLEVNLSTEPWTLREVTAELVAAGEEARETTEQERAAERESARVALVGVIATEPMLYGEAVTFLRDRGGLTRDGARALLREGEGTSWRVVERTDQRGKPRYVLPLAGGSQETPAEIIAPQNPRQDKASPGPFLRTLENTSTAEMPSDSPSAARVSAVALFPRSSTDNPPQAPEEALRLALDILDPTGWDAVNPAGAALLARFEDGGAR